MKRWRSAVLLAGAVGASLIGAAAPVQAQFMSDSTSFLDAVQKADGTKAQELLDKKAGTIILSRTPQGESVLHIVVKRRDMTWLQFMIGKGAPLDARDRDGNTALADAAQIGWSDGVGQLLDVGAAVDLPNNRGETPLILAVQAHDLDTVRTLVAHGANPKTTDHVAGMSAYDYARRDGRSAEIVKMLDLARPTVKKAVAGPNF
ncbi:MAG TPA: ankyrin repeat domain-containing protein [Sphingomonas sp.]